MPAFGPAVAGLGLPPKLEDVLWVAAMSFLRCSRRYASTREASEMPRLVFWSANTGSIVADRFFL